MKRARLAGAAVLLAMGAAGCGEPASATAPRGDPPPAAATIVAEQADDALRAAYLNADGSHLASVLAGPALAAARSQVRTLAVRGSRRDERLLARHEVHGSQSGARAEIVLEIQSEQRVVAAGEPPRPPARSLRQWRAGLAWIGGRWWVVEAGDLPPPQWWPAPAPAG